MQIEGGFLYVCLSPGEARSQFAACLNLESVVLLTCEMFTARSKHYENRGPSIELQLYPCCQN
jgi:hypothetical protein